MRRVYSSDYIEKSHWEIFCVEGGLVMLTIGDLIAVISLCLTTFGLGYAIGCNDKTTKK